MTWVIVDNIADDILHKDILVWLQESEVAWSRDEVNTFGRDLVNFITFAIYVSHHHYHYACNERRTKFG